MPQPPSNPAVDAFTRRPLPQARQFGRTMRRDKWWIRPLLTFIALTLFILYATWAAFQGNHFRLDPYLSPFYSPQLFGDPQSWFGPMPRWWPTWLPSSPALFVLWAPAGFRFTCYYYRGAYYKSFSADPLACAVGERSKPYRGESAFPLVLQNLHRYFLYLAIALLFFLAHDVWKAFWFPDPASGHARFGCGLGSLILLANCCLLAGYTFGCHSFRHLIGGWRDELSKSPISQKCHSCSHYLGRHHMNWAWCSLFAVAFSDLYIRLCHMGIWHDWRLF